MKYSMILILNTLLFSTNLYAEDQLFISKGQCFQDKVSVCNWYKNIQTEMMKQYKCDVKKAEIRNNGVRDNFSTNKIVGITIESSNCLIVFEEYGENTVCPSSTMARNLKIKYSSRHVGSPENEEASVKVCVKEIDSKKVPAAKSIEKVGTQ